MRTFVLLLALLSVVLAADCNNPLFKGIKFKADGNSTIDFPLEDAPGQDSSSSGVCGKFTSGSCCSPATFGAINRVFRAQRNDLSKARKQLEQLNNFDLRAQMPAEISTYFTVDCINALYAAFDEISNVIRTMAAPMIPCMSSMLKYNAGMLCLSCSPEWQLFINNTGGSIRMKIAQSSCDDLDSTCKPAFLGAIKGQEAIQNLTGKLTATFLNPSCLNPQAGGQHGGRKLQAVMDRIPFRRQLALASPPNFNVNKTEFCKMIMKGSQIDQDFLDSLNGDDAKVKSAAVSVGNSATADITASGGYDAVTVGQSSGLDTSAPVSSTSFGTIVTPSLVLLFAAVSMIFVL